MRIPIDILKSKKYNKLVFYKSGFDKISEYLFEFFTLFALVLISTSFILNEYNNHQRIILAIIVLAITLIVIGAIIYSILNTSKLKTITGLSKAKNKFDVGKISELKNWKVIDEGTNYKTLQVADKWSGFHWGKYLTIIFSKNELLLNCYSTDVFGAISPYHWYGNRKAEKQFIMEIELLKNVP
jgi:hypothetical protein